jgi:guanine deaminase
MSYGDRQSSWIVRGNVVVPVGNPFDKEADESRSLLVDDHPTAETEHAAEDPRNEEASSSSIVVLGPGLIMLVDHIVEVRDGFISSILPAHRYLYENASVESLRLALNYVELDPFKEFLIPGLIDLHIHAPQYSYAGTATDRPLMGLDGWLETYTFPAEARLQDDLDAARDVYSRVVRTTLRHGTTTALYYASLHLEPTKVLVEAALELGQRALVGKVCMDRNSPHYYVQTLDQNVRETEELIRFVQEAAGTLHYDTFDDDDNDDDSSSRRLTPIALPVITPRFIPTCSPALLASLGALATRYGCHVTTHISESVDEVEFTKSLDGMTTDKSEARALDGHGLLPSRRCVLAHGVHLSDADLGLLRDRQAAVAHCPLSNFFFAGRILRTRQLLERGNLVGLGTDVAGGYSPSMWNSCRMAVIASRALEQQQKGEEEPHDASSTSPSGENPSPRKEPPPSTSQQHVLDYRHALYLATLGGARALGLDARIGTFRVGMEFDAVVLSASGGIDGPLDVFLKTDSLADVFQKLCVLGDDRNVRRVFVQGRDVTVR